MPKISKNIILKLIILIIAFALIFRDRLVSYNEKVNLFWQRTNYLKKVAPPDDVIQHTDIIFQDKRFPTVQ